MKLIKQYTDDTRTTWKLPRGKGELAAVLKDNRLRDDAGNDVQRALDPHRVDVYAEASRALGGLPEVCPLLMPLPGDQERVSVLDTQHRLSVIAAFMDSDVPADNLLASAVPEELPAIWLRADTPVEVAVRAPLRVSRRRRPMSRPH
jgi:hypothetical protein